MRSDRHRELAASFSSVADVYERSRPDYPDAAVRWMTGDAPARVLDLGAGTGKLTSSLIDAGHDVVAVDPSEPMLEHLAMAMPQAEAHVGSAEAIPVADASVDVVVVAQAFHWFDHEVAVPEIARVLRPGGRLALIWNLRDASVPWVDELWTMINPDEPRRIELTDVEGRSPLGDSSLFGSVEHVTFEHTQHLDQQRLVELVTSRSYVAVQSPEERAPLLDAVRDIYDREALAAGIVLPYITYCFRTYRT
ncbi:class I SAM-dependent methyltransferase [Phytoactinopolyspora mesophila]|uniref:Methyltransferase domain-containing protein n=1 Tax=Phytoactinopolyspora mesophila TaxID=2650750 RepID=A0A7K3M3D2_9ACTN|nr:class I SAM-dependent methyltransferase [Phytoactinopolyspora mesophila]NDL57755.1 methyltransferase domain-containing protein [Phytoactinopolyspora mesophila]